MSLVMTIMIGAKILLGAVFDKIGSVRSAILTGLCMIASTLSIRFAGAGAFMPYVFSVCFGFGYSTLTVPYSYLIGQNFGTREFSSIYSLICTLGSLGGGIAATLTGMLYDRLGSYYPVWTIYFVLACLALTFLFLASKTAQVTGHAVLCFAYRLAPEHPYPAAVEDALHAWDYLMHLGYGARDTAVLGDSAGGNLALVLTLRLREAGRRLPRRLALFSPWTDMTCTGESYALCRDLDPMLTANYIHAVRHAYAAGRNLRDAHLSPLFADFSGFPPTLIQVGSHEILRSDATRLRRRMLDAGVLCRLEEWENLWHVFQMFPIKKAEQAMEQAGAFLLDGF